MRWIGEADEDAEDFWPGTFFVSAEGQQNRTETE
jgi:hypothetical protein